MNRDVPRGVRRFGDRRRACAADVSPERLRVRATADVSRVRCRAGAAAATSTAPPKRSTTGQLPGPRGLAPYRLLIVAATQDRDRLGGAAAFRPMGARPVDLFSLPILCAQAEVAAVLEDLSLLQDALSPLRALHQAGVRWCLGWPLLLARLIATAERLLGRARRGGAVVPRRGDGGCSEWLRCRSGSSLARARSSDRCGRQAHTARAMALEAARAFDRLGMLPLHQEALRLVGDRATHARVVRTVLFTDLVDSTADNVRRGDDAYVELLDQHNTILRRRLRQFDGVEIKHTATASARGSRRQRRRANAFSPGAMTSPSTTRPIRKDGCRALRTGFRGTDSSRG